ncbi:hypothetical protein [Trichormus sp. NMC-1]|uniref:TRADD-N-associated membrane domain-containing protein n=1 Tax=Trichormus sp. NMC-1 TaxID=1853259 RepID=UPI0008DC1BA8|nr:hypothetical protein [Trichormus sp. NMC-1]
MNKHTKLNNKLSKLNKPDLSVRSAIVQERLRQARYSFNLALSVAALSCGITFVGAGLLLANKAPEGAFTAVAGLVGSIGYIQIAKDANDRLDKTLAELDTDT